MLSRNEKNELSSNSSSLLSVGVVGLSVGVAGLLGLFVSVYGTNLATLGVAFEGLAFGDGLFVGVESECLGFGSISFKLLKDY